MRIQKIAVFCGSNTGYSPIYRLSAEMLADALWAHDITLVYGGAKVGLMGVLADRMLAHNGNVIGVIPRALVNVEIAHTGLKDLRIVDSMHERKALIASEADGFVMLPGGSGSLDEFFEVFTWAQLGYHHKPCGLLNVQGYYDGLLRFLDHTVIEGFLKATYRNMIVVAHSPLQLLENFSQYQAPAESKWIKNTVV